MSGSDETGPSEQRDRDRSLGVERDPSLMRRTPEDEARTRTIAIEFARLISDDKCEDVLVLDLRGHSQVTDFFVIGTGTSDRQMRSTGQHAAELGKNSGFELHRSNLGEREAKWVILDFVDVIVHLFEPDTRIFYDLEMLWGDVERVEWRRPEDIEDPLDDIGRNRAGLRADDVIPEG